jgi:hypothetical protein
MNQLLFTIEEVFSNEGYLQENQKKYYNIPLYQRGYKWEPKHVNKLLDDIAGFQLGADKFYCLQNITIVPKDDYFNVVDGQQRLTTLTILLSYLNKKGLVFNKVCFPENSIRKETNSFLNTVITKEGAAFPDQEWDFFIKNNPDYDHQDINHIYIVYQTIATWFESKAESNGAIRDEFCNTLLNHVKLIINKIDGSTSEEKIFGNLNSKRVPLDGADLVRAILITRVAYEEGKREGDIKNIVRVNERRVKIGWELDQINNWWSKKEVRNYFVAFISIQSEEIGVNVKLFNDTDYPINLLYLLFAEKRGEPKLTLELVEKNNNDALGLYKELLKLHYTLQDWFANREIYHYLGYLFNQRKADFKFSQLWKMWERTPNRQRFISDLLLLIKRSLCIEDELVNYGDPEINWYKDQPILLVHSLVFMDIIHSLKKNQAFLPHTAFIKQNNDIEHIFPKNPEEVDEKKDFVEFLNKNIVPKGTEFDLTKFDTKKDDATYLNKLKGFIDENIKSYKINSIGNLVLLYASLNRSIRNYGYSKKRARVIEYFHKGNFIQPHTFQVFVRYFNDKDDENNDYEHWTSADITANAKFINDTIVNFFNTKVI